MKVSAEEKRSWPAWSGTWDDVERLIARLEKAIEPLNEAARQTEQEKQSSEYPDGIPEHFKELYQERLDKARVAHSVEATVRQKKWKATLTGDLTDIINSDEFDSKQITELRLEATDGYLVIHPRCTVALSTLEGVTLTASGGETPWVRQTINELSDALTQSVPWWNHLRTGRFAACAFVFLMASAILGVESIGAADPETNEPSWMVSVIGFVLPWGGFAVYWLMRRMLPGFELLTPDGRGSRSAQALGVIGALLLGIVGSMIGNLLSWW